MDIFSVIPQRLDILAGPTFADLTVDSLTFNLVNDYLLTQRGVGQSLAIQNQAASITSRLELFPNIGDGTDGLDFSIYAKGTPPDISDSELVSLSYHTVVSGGPIFSLHTKASGAGTVLPIRIYAGANTTQLVLNVDNSIDMSGALSAASFTINTASQDFLFTNRANTALVIQGQLSAQTFETEFYTADGDTTDDVRISLFALGAPATVGSHYAKLAIGFDASESRYHIEGSEHGDGILYPIHLAADESAGADQLILATDGNVSMAGELTVAENINTPAFVITQRVQGYNDANTYFVFASDQVEIWAGGARMLLCFEAVVGDRVHVNPSLANIDFQVSGDTVNNLIKVDASVDKVGIDTSTPTLLFSVKEKAGITPIGGYAIKLTNNTGVNSVEGQLVEADNTDENSYKTADANALNVIGVVYNAGIADGSEVWIVFAGIAEVLLDGGGCVHHDRLISSATAGSADVNNAPAVAVHFQEIGHAIETVVGAGLAKAMIHFL